MKFLPVHVSESDYVYQNWFYNIMNYEINNMVIMSASICTIKRELSFHTCHVCYKQSSVTDNNTDNSYGERMCAFIDRACRHAIPSPLVMTLFTHLNINNVK